MKKEKKKIEEMNKKELLKEVLKYVAILTIVIAISIVLNIYAKNKEKPSTNIITDNEMQNTQISNDIDETIQRNIITFENKSNEDYDADIQEKEIYEEQQIYLNYINSSK